MLGERGALDHVKIGSRSSDLKVTDIRSADVRKVPMQCTMVEIYTNQGLVGYGEVWNFANKRYALTLKSRLIGKNPCNVNGIFRKIKQFGGQPCRDEDVSEIEVALWSLVDKTYGVPVYQLLGGRFRDEIRLYCDTDVVEKPDGKKMGKVLRSKMEEGSTTFKMDLGIGLLYDVPGALNVPLGFVEQPAATGKQHKHIHGIMNTRAATQKRRGITCVEHCRTGIQIVQKGTE